MSKMLSIAGLGLALAGSILVGSATIASAQNLDIQVGPNGIRPVIRDQDRDRGPRGECSPREAMAAARDEGYRHPRIVRVTDRRVVVEGMTEEGLDRITFANRPGCPET
ncbi:MULTISPECIES: hypothetical protein [unclassified Rhizobium]|uniref:hypothetical protein n=1 Tax=unclassified Rhizobium TaxID=2613769 RepID=UPI001ADAB8CA|nr:MULTISPECIES: hypothetical protein [unclassified Rhizobium]MBO9100565.1 hypothetical protein [Rhizobium sp. L58/93]MBO9136073.1 hypothetical protein [Rhizobium sp. B209b/85]MBO9171384.1 hypothetical protein [Rhizobium sp. L245/93]MBO9187251.1 hypothetical protein [Rhizobium sp. E27B/91]QXZ87933.1 hypothetical protein J5287_30105 [Rhizobium sp. K1/93]